jgi:UDP-N-acetylmuramate--alanine ligase
MFNLIEDKFKKVHFIGIGGISMSGLAEILVNYGYTVSGSDRAESNLTQKLQKLGVKITIGQLASNIDNQDLVVYTAAISEDNPELLRAKELKIPVMDRAEFLGHIMKAFKKSIAVSGTHGKTTTTSMLSLILLNAMLDPTIMVGGELDAIGGNVKTGKSEYLVAEACEYKGSFLKFFPYIGIILNIDADHLDYYRDIDEIQDTFGKFADLLPENGLLIGWSEDSRITQIMKNVNCNKITYGINSGDFLTKDLTFNLKGCASFEVVHKGELLGKLELAVPGEHNALNALAAVACAHFLEVPFETIAESLYNFVGTHRRFEKKGEVKGITVIDDYAHHPVEIMATLKAAKNYPHRKIYCIFQPHTYTRTLTLFNEFANAFINSDKLIILDIYAAREKDTGVINSQMLCAEIIKNGVDAEYIKSFDDAINHLKTQMQSGDILITMGAGDVFRVGEDFLLRA